MAAQIKDQQGEKPKLVFQFECATRGKMMSAIRRSCSF